MIEEIKKNIEKNRLDISILLERLNKIQTDLEDLRETTGVFIYKESIKTEEYPNLNL